MNNTNETARNADEIREIFKKNGITGYRLAQDLDVTQVGADKFLNGETKNPYKSTLKMYNSYIDAGFKNPKVLYNEKKDYYVENSKGEFNEENQLKEVQKEYELHNKPYKLDHYHEIVELGLKVVANWNELKKLDIVKNCIELDVLKAELARQKEKDLN